MIRVGTVFSGIGAIEHALQRMNLDCQVMFACDNGDVDLLSKDIKPGMEEICSELAKLEEEVKEVETETEDDIQYKEELEGVLEKIKNDYFSMEESAKTEENPKEIKSLAERVGMLYEKINSFRILKELAKIKDYSEKKRYVDNLYRGQESRNKVKQSYMVDYNVLDEDFYWNVSFLDGRQYVGKVDLFVGRSLCQSFSLVGKQRGLEDTRGTLFYEFARLVKEVQPKVFIYENVRAILTNDNGRTWGKMKEVFNELRYQINYKMGDKSSVLNAKNYGIPQKIEKECL